MQKVILKNIYILYADILKFGFNESVEYYHMPN